MRTGTLFIIGIFLGLLPLSPLYISAQPPEEITGELGSLAGMDENGKTMLTRLSIEDAFLAKARHNIEQYRKGGAIISFIDGNGKPVEKLCVEIDQLTQDFLFGNLTWDMVRPEEDQYKIEEQKEKFRSLFNLAVFPFYWGSYERKAGHPEWQRFRKSLDWAIENGITCKGHPLGWTSPSGTPRWLLELPEETASKLYKARIFNNIIGYSGEIDMWDVVNEPVNTVPWEVALADKENTNSLRYDISEYGTDQFAPWVEQSFKWAYEANPAGNYILNEYFTLAVPEIRDRFYKLIRELLRRNTPVKGIGIQAHEPRQHWFSPVELYNTLDLYSEFGLPIHITEFIPQSSGKEITGWRSGIWTEDTQAEFAEQFYTLAFGHPSVASITWWGVSDRNIWLEGGGLLDEDYNPKPVYNRLFKLIKEEWMTRGLTLETDINGKIEFRGFFGSYQVEVTGPDNSKKIFRIHLKENGSNWWQFTLE
jgi:endo-1,4-beta-xylanase